MKLESTKKTTRTKHANALRPGLITAAIALACGFGAPANAAVSDDVVKIGVLTDMSGTYSDFTGQGAVIAARMAVKDFSKDGTVLGKKVEVVSADHQNKADIGSEIARSWIDRDKVDVITELVTTSVALAVMDVVAQKNRIALVSGAASLPITNERCNANTVHWVYDSYGLAAGTAKAVVKSGKKNWYFIAADYAAGEAMMNGAAQVVTASGGKVVGSTKHPFPSSDFSSFLLSAQASGADVIALANGGQDTITAIKQAAEFGITGSKQTLVPIVLFINDVHALGLQTAKGLTLTEGFYWNRDDKTRAWSRRFFEQAKKMPSMAHAGVYSSVMNYLKAVEKTGSDDAGVVMKYLKSTPIDDGLFKGNIRADGKFAHDMLLLEVKKPSESTEPWDYYHVRAVIPASDAALPLEKSKCSLVRQ
ncbi:ABC transporter substrate-binding protein [Cognatazoarcus halotolerans]|uniref:ABC transporter substrate-binding protein n=1 Tax=Cognatazoarcus halotolerans TaxID=2686016 RepID=UPI001357C62F|nr:ABC transporter substrate-binding protein [Cognatazoarcus halotolerans]MCB1899932.1 ABC transporter substrate-binding protein [Rhodocyclaceae bacterium]MCP5309180.1 ABC transporter substrate-binding protein [Zoogloeaceae bacterium]